MLSVSLHILNLTLQDIHEDALTCVSTGRVHQCHAQQYLAQEEILVANVIRIAVMESHDDVLHLDNELVCSLDLPVGNVV